MPNDAQFVSGNPRVRIARLPEWVVHDPFEMIEPEPDSVSGGLCTLYYDSQIDLRGQQRAWNWRFGQKVITLAGAERAAHFSAVFDPACQELEIHYICVRRGQATTNHARAEIFDVLRREPSMERLVLDGRLTVAAVIPDVRPGDVVEACCTIYGANACLQGRHSTWIMFSSADPILERRHRLIRPSKRMVATRAFNSAPEPEIFDNGAIVDSRWRSTQRCKTADEDCSPPWVFRSAAVQFSEYASWRDVAALFTPLYHSPDDLPHDLASLVDQLGRENISPDDRASAALFLVQKRLRYLALSFGEGGYVPRPINVIWETGYGDCKDASRLLVAVARRLGLDACPALVSTTHGPGLDTWLPTAEAFNHCIVRLRIDGKTYWLDPTSRAQSGRLDRLHQPHWGWALPLTAEAEATENRSPWTVPLIEATAGLEHMGPLMAQLVTDVREHITFGPQVHSPARYECHTDYYLWRADQMRNRLANEGISTVGQEYLQCLRTHWLDVAETSPLEIVEDAPLDRLTTIERYEIPVAWRRTEEGVCFTSSDLYLRPELPPLPSGTRVDDIHLGIPRILRRQLTLDLPRDWPCQVWDETHQLDGLRYRSKLTSNGRKKVVLKQELTIQSLTIPAARIERYCGVTAALREKGDVYLWTTDAWSHGGRLAVLKETIGTRVLGGILLGFWAVFAIVKVLRALNIAG